MLVDTFLDLRSDTVTKPTDAMRWAMHEAEVGDDVMGEDPSVIRLEKMGAELFGKEDCMFAVSGSMSNMSAVLSLTSAGDQIIVHDKSHMFNLEVAGLGRIAGVQPRAIPAPDGEYDLAQLEANIITTAIQTAPTTLICLENTFDLNQGLVVRKEHIDAVCKIAHDHNIPVYMDGARIVNAAIALNMPVAALCQNVDVASVCMSKGLSCPVGSLLAGPKEVIDQARRMRQMLGGGWRQAGVLAAAGVIALHETNRLADDHKKARELASGLKALGLGIDMQQVQTNVVRIDLLPVKRNAADFCAALKNYGVKAKPIGPQQVRMICHRWIDFDDIPVIVKAVDDCLNCLGV